MDSNKYEMKYNVESIQLTDEELNEAVENKDYEKIVYAFSKVVNKYTVGYDDVKQEIYIKLIEDWINKEDVRNWKNYLYSRIKSFAKDYIKYEHNFKNLSKREADIYVKLKGKEVGCSITKEEREEMKRLECKANRQIGFQFYETGDCVAEVHGNTYDMEFRENTLVDEIKKILTEKEFDIFYMNTVMNYTTRDIANMYNRHESNISRLIQKCKNKLKNSEKINLFKNNATK